MNETTLDRAHESMRGEQQSRSDNVLQSRDLQTGIDVRIAGIRSAGREHAQRDAAVVGATCKTDGPDGQ